MDARSRAFAQFVFRLSLAGFVSVAALVPAGASGNVTQFKQSVAEAAAVDDGLAAFYRERDYAPLWTGEGATERRTAFLTGHFPARQRQPHGCYLVRIPLVGGFENHLPPSARRFLLS